jgi:DNA-directed RNA polymerase subunit RPC12/RpoP
MLLASNLPSLLMPCADCAGRMVYKTKRICSSELEDTVYTCRICGAELIRTSIRAGCKLDH